MRRLAEISTLHNSPLYLCLVDLKKAFDWVQRKALWHILPKYGISETLMQALKDLHTGNTGKIRVDGHLSEDFDMEIGVRQGCVLAAPVFAAFIDFIMRLAFGTDGFPKGITILYRQDGKLNEKKGCTLEEFIQALAYADDIILIAQ
jgi:Reverse transcriptase (RNA-dependent DNA polymerase)